MADAILILNAGSSSLKFSVYVGAPRLELLCRGQVEPIGATPVFRAFDAGGRLVAEKAWSKSDAISHAGAVAYLLSWAGSEVLHGHRLIAAGHRVVHGGPRYARPVRVDAEVVDNLKALTPLAPLHMPHNIAAIEAVGEAAPALPQVACFDTAFHRTMPQVAQTFALPRKYTEAGVRRYGFHGLSYEYVAQVLKDIDPRAAKGRTIVAHLGNGASMCAMEGGRSIATTMGLSALDGLVMGTRCGSIDPGVLLYLGLHEKLGMQELLHMLHQRCGLLGVSGISGDMRTLLGSDDLHAREAVELFIYRAAREIGSLAAALGGLDALVFTGGIGENSAPVRAGICKASAWLGVELDETANQRSGPGIGRGGARVAAWVIPTNEELMIARHTASVLGGATCPGG